MEVVVSPVSQWRDISLCLLLIDQTPEKTGDRGQGLRRLDAKADGSGPVTS